MPERTGGVGERDSADRGGWILGSVLVIRLQLITRASRGMRQISAHGCFLVARSRRETDECMDAASKV